MTTETKPVQSAGQSPKAEASELLAALEYIEMADNRLECEGCGQCVSVARSYLVEAIAALRLAASRPEPVSSVEPSLNQQALDHPIYDNPRDPFASTDRLPLKSPALDPVTVEVPMLADIAQIIKKGWLNGYTHEEVAQSVLDEFGRALTDSRPGGNAVEPVLPTEEILDAIKDRSPRARTVVESVSMKFDIRRHRSVPSTDRVLNKKSKCPACNLLAPCSEPGCPNTVPQTDRLSKHNKFNPETEYPDTYGAGSSNNPGQP